MQRRLVTVFGGSGFIGRHLVRRLARQDWIVRVAVRDPEAAKFLQPMGGVGQIVIVRADLAHEAHVEAAVADAEAVVNLVGILYERGRATFAEVHLRGAERVAKSAAAAGARHLVHVSAIGASRQSRARYASSKAAGEEAVRSAFPQAVVLRPSVVFGPEDDFLNRFAAMARCLPALPVVGASPRLTVRDGRPVFEPLGGGGPRFQPVYVGDVAEAIARALADPKAAGKTFELGGPRVYSFRDLMEIVLAEIRRRRLLVPVPIPLAKLQAAVLGLLPKPPLTRDQVEMLKRDNVVGEGALGLADLGIAPTPMETVLPTYLARFRPGSWRRKEVA
ncbi:MAG: complex I NDUFA9 subunit family protein [Proteobacteria bacterium]|nr:complex I NDUFA9 subunit family protein [Pseudomonadota bacterium]